MIRAGMTTILAMGLLAPPQAPVHVPVSGTIWAANRGAHSIRGFDAGTGAMVRTIPMAPNSQPGDLAFAKGKLYVSEEFGTPPAIAIVDPDGDEPPRRIVFPAGYRPHHVHADRGGNLVAVGLFGTDMVAVVDTRDDTLLGPWDSNPATTNGRVHAGVFSNDGNTLYLANEGANELIAMDPRSGAIFWRMTVAAIHEIALTHDGKTAYVSRRTANRLAMVDLEARVMRDVLTLGLPDTLELSANEKRLTVGLRTSPAQLAVVDTDDLSVQLITLTPEAGSVGGHQWTSPSRRITFAAFEGGTNPGIAVIDHSAGNQIIRRLDYPGRPHGVDQAQK